MSKYPANWQKLRQAVLERDGHECTYCFYLSAGPLVVDHQVPLALGGTNDMENLATACADCNSKKGAMPFERWLVKAGFLNADGTVAT